MNKDREIEIEYNSFMQDVNDYAKKRAEEANNRLRKKGIESFIEYTFEDTEESIPRRLSKAYDIIKKTAKKLMKKKNEDSKFY